MGLANEDASGCSYILALNILLPASNIGGVDKPMLPSESQLVMDREINFKSLS